MIVWCLLGFGALLLVHLLEPNLFVAWSFAGLRLGWGSPLPALLAAIVVLVLVAVAWQAPLGRRPFPRAGATATIGATLALWIVLSLVGLRWPSPDTSADVLFLSRQLQIHGNGNVRWLLAVPLLQLLYAPAHSVVSAATGLRIINALFSSLSVLLTFAIAMRLGRSIREVLAIVLLVWTGFGNLQLALGYIDIYPLVQLMFALYLWTALRFLDGDGAVLWPIATAALGYCFYIGSILLGPSLLVVAYVAYQRGALLPFVGAGVVALLLVGLATIPTFGMPFAFRAWLATLAYPEAHGLSPDSQTLPLGYMLSALHAGEVLSAVVLLDGTGLVLAATLSPRSVRGLLFWSLLAPGLAFIIAMDPLWGPYADWDLFSYLTLPLGVAAGLAFVEWSRAQPRLAGLVLGLALATSTVHLLARLNALELDFDRHIAASPYHLKDVPNGFYRAHRNASAF